LFFSNYRSTGVLSNETRKESDELLGLQWFGEVLVHAAIEALFFVKHAMTAETNDVGSLEGAVCFEQCRLQLSDIFGCLHAVPADHFDVH
jgi:hypothetical protein